MTGSNSFRFYMGVLVCFIIFISLFMLNYFLEMPDRKVPVAERGVLDLTGWDFRTQGLVNLNGQWEFYKGQLLKPADFHNGMRADVSWSTVPGTWKGNTEDGGMERRGYGTYRLRVIVPDTGNVLGLKIRNIRMSHALYINGQQAGARGSPSADIRQHTPGNTPYTVYFYNHSHEIDIVLQVSNYEFVTGGIVSSIALGLQDDMAKLEGLQIGVDIGVILMLVTYGLYHLFFYFLGRREKTYLLSGLYLLILSLERSLSGEKILLRLWSDLPFHLAYKLLDLSEFVSAIIIIRFFCSIDGRLMSTRCMRWTLTPLLVYIAAVLSLPYRVHVNLKYVFLLYLAAVVIYIFIRMIYLYLHSQSTLNRKEWLLFIGGWISLMIFLVDGMLYSENVVSSDLAGKLGLISFISMMHILLAERYSKAYAKNEQLTTLQDTRTRMLANIAHDLGSPITGIQAYLQLMKEGKIQNVDFDAVTLMVKKSEEIKKLTDELFELSKLESKEFAFHYENVHVKELIEDAFHRFEPELRRESFRFRLGFLETEIEGKQALVRIDRFQIQRVLRNYIANAMKFSFKDKVIILNGFVQKAVSANGIGYEFRIEIADRGVGIAPEELPMVFQRFYTTREVNPGGSGLGLAISKEIVEQHGGRVGAESVFGEGSTFYFTLPIAD